MIVLWLLALLANIMVSRLLMLSVCVFILQAKYSIN